MLISIEGLDGVGKSSLVTTLSQSTQFTVIEKPIKSLLELTPNQSNHIKEKIYGNYSSNVQAMYYLLGYLSALEDGNNQNYILDRGFLSTYYFSFCQENSELFDFFAYNYGFPDLTIVLYASINERINRIYGRNNIDKDLKKKRIYTDNYEKYLEAIHKYNIPHIAINTEKFTKEEVSKLVIKILNLWMQDGEYRNKILDIFHIDNLEQFECLNYLAVEKKLTNTFNNSKKYVRKKEN